MSEPKVISGWPKGVDNVHESFALPEGTLRAGTNVDVMDSGKVRRRKGSTQSVATVGTHSLWKHDLVDQAYYAAGSVLYSLSKALTSAAVVTDLATGAKIAYAYMNGAVAWTNGRVTGKLTNGVNSPLGVETPAGVATLAATTGSLPAGRYQITTTFRTASGEEGGAQNPTTITLGATGGVTLSNMPAAQSAAAISRCIYMTLDNGDMMYKVATLPVATTSYTISNTASMTTTIRTQNLQPMPAGSILAFRNGVLYVAVGPMIYYSEPMRYGLCDTAKNFYMFSDDVTVMLSTPGGLYVCADKTYFLENPGSAEVAQRPVFPFGGISGTGVYLPGSDDVSWFSPRGQVSTVDGRAALVSEKVFAPGAMALGASFVREQEGIRQIVNVVHLGDADALEFTGA